jgi:hypothetical protein
MKNNLQLTKIARQLQIDLKGVVSKDMLKTMTPQNGSYIINMSNLLDNDGNFLEGTHWTGLYLHFPYAFYFDSFGIPPSQEVMNFIHRFKHKLYSTKEIQDLYSSTCGDFVLLFLWFMTKHSKFLPKERYEKFLKMFSTNDTKMNERILKKMIVWRE